MRKIKHVLEAMKYERSKKNSSREPGKVTKRKNVNSFFPSPSLSLSLSHTPLNTHSWSEARPAALIPRLLGRGGCRRHEPTEGRAEPTLTPSPALKQVLPCWRKEVFPSFLPTQLRPHGQCPPRGTPFSNYFLTYSNTFHAYFFWLKK